MRRKIAAILVLNFLTFSSVCRAFEIEDCGSKVGKFTSAIINCDMTKSACDLISGTNATLMVDFTVEKDVTNVTAVVHGIVMNVPIPFPLKSAYACETPSSGITCPLASGGTYRYKNELPVLKSYPKVSVTVKWELRDENNDDIFCMLVPAKVK